MILQLVGGVLVATALVLLLRAFWIRSGLTPARAAIILLIAALTFGLIVLIATGRLSWLFAVGAAAAAVGSRLMSLLSVVPVLNRIFPGWHRRVGGKFWGRRNNRAGAPGGDSSTIATPELQMTLHHATGHMEGEVLVGVHRGRFLSELDTAALTKLLETLEDAESRRLLTAYLERTHPDWNAQGHARASGTDVSEGDMDRARALAVLGLADGATPDEIVTAHRRLIQKLHPDRGGSTYLATTLNEAKRVLLDS